MHAAPAVTHPTGHTPLLAVLLLSLWALGVAAAFGGLSLAWGSPMPTWKMGVLLGAPLLAGVALARWWGAQRPRRLAWDGAQWRLTPAAVDGRDGAAVQLQVCLDLQRALLLRVHDPDSRRGLWLWVEAGTDPARWHLLRCAMHADAPATGAAQGTGEGARA